LIEELIQKS
jgi:hypothetical protein